MSIAPVRAAIEVNQPPADAFAIFASRISAWWGGKTIGEKPAVSITIEPHDGGGWFETDADGQNTRWGQVLAWDPPHRLLLAWELNSHFRPDPSISTEVEILFTPLTGGGTLVSLEHRNLERFGVDAEAVSRGIGEGWPERLAGFGRFAGTQDVEAKP